TPASSVSPGRGPRAAPTHRASASCTSSTSSPPTREQEPGRDSSTTLSARPPRTCGSHPITRALTPSTAATASSSTVPSTPKHSSAKPFTGWDSCADARGDRGGSVPDRVELVGELLRRRRRHAAREALAQVGGRLAVNGRARLEKVETGCRELARLLGG